MSSERRCPPHNSSVVLTYGAGPSIKGKGYEEKTWKLVTSPPIYAVVNKGHVMWLI